MNDETAENERAVTQKEREMTVRYRHYKGGVYEHICEATMEADLTPIIVYRAADGSIWCRPKSVFFEWVDVDGVKVQRFKEID